MEVAIDRLKSRNNLAIIGQLIKLNFGDKKDENALFLDISLATLK